MNKILKLSFQNRKYLAFILLAGLCLSLIPLHFAGADDSPDLSKCEWHTPWHCFAAVIHYLITYPIRIAALWIAIPLAIFAMVSGVGYTIITVLLGWIKTIVLNVPVIPSEVGVVKAGFDITQNLANILLILVLVFIGLATILRVKDYEAKKLLPKLIIVALLVNFSPVLVGFIVDISNIVTNFFLNMGSFEYTVSIWQMIGNYFFQVFSILTQMGTVWNVTGYIIGIIVLGIVLIAFFTYSSWIYLMIVRILIVRIIALWILMILAPIAFLFYILPVTRGLATKWWKALIQWAILGVPIGFFLFLSFKILQDTTQINSFFHAADLSGNIEGVNYGGYWDFSRMNVQLAKSFGMMLAPLVSLVMLHIGYKLSRTYMPAFAEQMITKSEQALKKGAKVAGMAALTIATAGAGSAAAALGTKGLAGAAQIAQRMDMGAKTMKGGKILRAFTKPMSAMTQGAEAAFTPTLLKYQGKQRGTSADDLKFIRESTPETAQKFNESKDKQEAGSLLLDENEKKGRSVQRTAAMAESGSLEFADKAYRDKAMQNARDIFISQNPHYQTEALSVAKALPETFEGEEGQKAYMAAQTMGLKDSPTDPTDNKLTQKKQELEEEIKEVQDEMERRITDEITIDIGLKYNYITKDDIEKDKAAALLKAKTGLQDDVGRTNQNEQEMRDRIEKELENAAVALFVKNQKPEDVKKAYDPTNSYAKRVGITMGNSKNLQRVQDQFGRKKFDRLINDPGGLNSATDTPEKADYFATKVNPAMARTAIDSIAAREMGDIEIQRQMTDTQGRPTNTYGTYKQGLRIKTMIEKDADLMRAHEGYMEIANSKRVLEEIEDDIKHTHVMIDLREQEKQAHERLKKAKQMGNKSDIKNANTDLGNIQASIKQTIDQGRIDRGAPGIEQALSDSIKDLENHVRANIETDKNKMKNWQEIIRLINPKSKKNR